MTYENIKYLIQKTNKKILTLWTFIACLTIMGILGYHFLTVSNNVLKNHILYFSDINGEATFLLQQNKKVDENKTGLASWVTLHKDNFLIKLPGLQPEVVFLEKLGAELYRKLGSEGELPISEYQNFYDQLQLLKRMLIAETENSPIEILKKIGLPIYLLLIIIAIFFTSKIHLKLSNMIMHKNSIMLEELWDELQNFSEDPIPNFTKPIVSMVDDTEQNTGMITSNLQELTIELAEIKKNLSIFLEEEKQKLINNNDEDLSQGYTEKVTYIQKLLSRLFSRSERATTLAKASSENGFQAGILALNISIEASRNGEHGKPFLAVSDRVKDFAEKSSTISQAILDELKDADGAIRKAYAIGKTLLNETPSEEARGSAVDFDLIASSLHKINSISSLVDVLYRSASELKNNASKKSSASPIDFDNLRQNEAIKNTMVRNFERLYRFTYGTDPKNIQ